MEKSAGVNYHATAGRLRAGNFPSLGRRGCWISKAPWWMGGGRLLVPDTLHAPSMLKELAGVYSVDDEESSD